MYTMAPSRAIINNVSNVDIAETIIVMFNIHRVYRRVGQLS